VKRRARGIGPGKQSRFLQKRLRLCDVGVCGRAIEDVFASHAWTVILTWRAIWRAIFFGVHLHVCNWVCGACTGSVGLTLAHWQHCRRSDTLAGVQASLPRDDRHTRRALVFETARLFQAVCVFATSTSSWCDSCRQRQLKRLTY
jgi:hypothetical protein